MRPAQSAIAKRLIPAHHCMPKGDNEEIEIGLRCVGAPINDHTGRMVGAISVAAPSARLTNQKIPLFGRLVMEVAADISKELGYEKQKRANAR